MKKVGRTFCHYTEWTFASFSLVFFTSQIGYAFPVQSNFQMSPEVLTTEKIWTVDPQEVNPHRRRWVLERIVKLEGLETVKIKGEYEPRISQMVLTTTAYVRGPGSYFRDIELFPCGSESSPAFATRAGSIEAANSAGKAWAKLVEKEKPVLETRLRAIRGEFPELAKKNAQKIFDQWLANLDADWRKHDLSELQESEWKYYQKQAAELGICKKAPITKKRAIKKKIETFLSASDHSSLTSEIRWKDVLEPVDGPSSDSPLLALAPSRRWSGLFSVKVTLYIGDHELVGKFLIDSGAPISVISPTFLQAQGIYPAWIEEPNVEAKKVYWSGGSGIGKVADVAQVKVSGLSIPVHKFILQDTDFFGPPDSFSTCCDGILGADFLRHYAVEFRTSLPNEVRLYSPEGFQLEQGTPWVETSSNPDGEVISACDTAGTHVVRWDTGSDGAIEVPPVFLKSLKGKRNSDLKCDDLSIAKSVLLEPKEQELFPSPDQKSTNVGMEVLGRGRFTFDLGHGRIWFDSKGLQSPIIQNRSPLNLIYGYENGDRVLRVATLRASSSEGRKIVRDGIRVGTKISHIDSKPTAEMDQWEVEQHLAGVYGDTVELQWATGKKTFKTAILKIR